MKSKLIAGFCGILFALPIVQFMRADDRHDNDSTLEARMTGSSVVPSVSTAAKGAFSMKIAQDDSQFTYVLTFSGINSPVTQSHIHFAQPGVAGGIMIWLCQGTVAAPAGDSVPVCPTSPGGTVTGTVTPANVVGPAAQGISPGEFSEALAAIRRGLAYANVHSTTFPSGEISGQIRD